MQESKTTKDEYDIEEIPNGFIATPKPKWECFLDRSYYDMWCVRRVGERAFEKSLHMLDGVQAKYLVKLLEKYNVGE